jgi:hypothetical protein
MAVGYEKIAFASTMDGHVQIYIMNPDGSGLTRITNSLYADTYPAWSPDGSKIAFRPLVSCSFGQMLDYSYAIGLIMILGAITIGIISFIGAVMIVMQWIGNLGR